MKFKSIIVIFVIAICIILTSCQGNVATNINDNYGTSDTGTNASQNTSNDNLPTGEARMLYFESYDEYLAFIEENEIPNDFIHYDSLKAFGDFASFYSDLSLNYYMYTFMDQSRTKICVSIEPIKNVATQTSLSILSADVINTQDMRTITTNSKGVFYRNGMKFTYVAGRLLSISWEAEDLKFTITMSNMLDFYPKTTNTIVGKIIFDPNTELITK